MTIKHKNPNQFELFEEVTNREMLPIDSGESSKKEPLPPGIINAIASVRKHLKELNADPKKSDPESLSVDH